MAGTGRQTHHAASGVIGLEPAPLIDLPFHLLLQVQMVVRIAALYGHAMGGSYNKQVITAMLSSVSIRYMCQQISKFIPFVGWLASGVLAALGTWALGQLMLRYFEHGRRHY